MSKRTVTRSGSVCCGVGGGRHEMGKRAAIVACATVEAATAAGAVLVRRRRGVEEG